MENGERNLNDAFTHIQITVAKHLSHQKPFFFSLIRSIANNVAENLVMLLFLLLRLKKSLYSLIWGRAKPEAQSELETPEKWVAL